MALSKDLKLEIVRADSDPLYNIFSGQTLLSEDYLLAIDLSNDLKRYEELELDPHVASVLQKRKMAVTAHEWRVDAADSSDEASVEAADLVRSLLNLFNFDELSQHMLNAILLGYTVAEIMWASDELGKFGKIDRPVEVRGKDSSRFMFARPNEKEDPRYQYINGYELRQFTRNNRYQGEPLPINKMVVHSFGSKIGNPNGIGVGNRLWWMVRFKKEITKFWLIFLDRFAQPTPIGHYPAGGSKAELEAFLRSISQGSWAALPEGYKVELLEAQRSGTVSTYEGFQNWCDSQISKAVLGETLTTTPQDTGGSFAATSVHNDVRVELSKADADLLSYSLNKYLIEPIIRVNRPGVKPPTVWRVFEEQVDLSQRASRDYQLFQMGFRLTIEKLTEIYGDGYVDTQAAEENDPNSLENVLEGMNAPAPTEEPTAEPTELPEGLPEELPEEAATPDAETPEEPATEEIAEEIIEQSTDPSDEAPKPDPREVELEPIAVAPQAEPEVTESNRPVPDVILFSIQNFTLAQVSGWLKQYRVPFLKLERTGLYYRATQKPIDPNKHYVQIEIGQGIILEVQTTPPPRSNPKIKT